MARKRQHRYEEQKQQPKRQHMNEPEPQHQEPQETLGKGDFVAVAIRNNPWDVAKMLKMPTKKKDLSKVRIEYYKREGNIISKFEKAWTDMVPMKSIIMRLSVSENTVDETNIEEATSAAESLVNMIEYIILHQW